MGIPHFSKSYHYGCDFSICITGHSLDSFLFIGKGMSMKTHNSKLRFSKFKKFVSKSVLGKLQFTQISLNFKTSCCNLKIRVVGRNQCEGFFYSCFIFEIFDSNQLHRIFSCKKTLLSRYL